MAVEFPGGEHLDLHRLVRLAMTLLADGPGVHILRHVSERRDLSNLVKILRAGNHSWRTHIALLHGALARHASLSGFSTGFTGPSGMGRVAYRYARSPFDLQAPFCTAILLQRRVDKAN